MKKTLSLLAAAILALTLTVCGVHTTFAADKVNARIGFITQEYIGNNIAEIPYIEYDGETNMEIESINRSLNQGIQWIYEDFLSEADLDRDWMEIKSYPFTTERYLQVVVTHIVYPNYGTDGDMFSINYDKKSDEWITTEDALAAEGLDYDAVYASVEALFEPEIEGMYIGELKISGFLIHELAEPFLGREGSYVEYLLEVTVENPASDPWKSFYSYSPLHESLTVLNSYCLFDPYNMDETDIPLAYMRNLPDRESEYIMPWLLAVGLEDFRQIDDGMYIDMDGMMFVRLETYASNDFFDEDSLAAFISALEDADLQDLEIARSDEYSALLTFPAWLVSYTTGNEDGPSWVDLIFQTDLADYRVHVGITAGNEDDYTDKLESLFNSVNLEPPFLYYSDTNAMIMLVYPSGFTMEYEEHESGAVIFPSAYSGEKLIYCVFPNEEAQDELFAFIDMTSTTELGDGRSIGWGAAYNEETETEIYGAYVWISDLETYFAFDGIEIFPAAAVVCETEEMALYWLERIEAGDIRFQYMDGMEDESDWIDISEEDAIDILSDALRYRLDEGLVLVPYGLYEKDGVTYWQFALAEDNSGTSTLEFYAVSVLDGEIFSVDIITDEYTPFSIE